MASRRVANTQSVLVADIVPASLAILVDCLEKNGYRVIAASDGNSAIQRARSAKPALILLDAGLPGMDGYETCRRLKSDPKTTQIPVLIMLSGTSPDEKARAFEAGCADFVSRPVDPLELLARVKTNISLHALRDQVRSAGEPDAELRLENKGLHAQIAELRRAEEELFNSRQMLRLVLDNIPQRVFWKDRNSVFVGGNLPLARDCGFSDPSELTGKDDYQTTAAAFADHYRTDDRRVIETGIPKLNFEEPQIKPDGSKGWLQTSKVPLYGKDGNIIGVLGTYEDITERKRAEEALRDSERRFRAVFDQTFQFMGLLTLDGVVIQVNESVLKVYGSEGREAIGKFFWDGPWSRHSHELREKLGESTKKASQGEVVHFETEYSLPDGSIRYIDLSIKPVIDEEGKVVLVIPEGRDITERKEIEDALRESETRLANIFEFLPDATVVVDNYKRVIAWNRALEQMSGVIKEEAIGKLSSDCMVYFYGEKRPHLIDLLDAEDEQLASKYQGIRKQGNVLLAEAFIPKGYGGKGAYVLATAAPLFDAHGNRAGSIEAVRDITRRKLAEDAVRESEKRLSEIFDFLPDATFAIDTEGKVIAWNRAIEEMTGVKAEQVLGKGDYEYSLAFYGVRRPILIDLVFKSDKKIEKKYWFVQRDGNTIISENKVHMNGRDQVLFAKAGPLFDSKGKMVGAIESIRDISDRMLAEAEVRAYAEELLAINRVATICTSSLDLQSILDQALNETLRIVGLEGGIICLVRPDNTLEPAAHRDMTSSVLNNLASRPVQAGETIWGRCTLEGKPTILADHESVLRRGALEGFQGDNICFHASFPLIVQQKCLGVLCLFTRRESAPSKRSLKLIETISAQLALGMQNALLYREVQQYTGTLEEKVRQRTMQYEIANKELESFSYSVSHDLRSPLRGIEGWSQALVEDCIENIDQKGRKYLDRIQKETERMGKLIDGLLELSRVSRSDMRWESVDLSIIVRSIAERLKETEPERCVEFIIPQGLATFGDPRLLEVMMSNLLGNAWKFTSRKASARIEFGRTFSDGDAVWYVRDDGVGFDMKFAGRLFAPFQRMHLASEFPGTGIGLATVQRIVHRHGGQVWAEARLDSGATFFFTL